MTTKRRKANKAKRHGYWLHDFPGWLFRAAANGRRYGTFPKGWSTGRWAAMDGVRKLAPALVDHWGAHANRLILEPYQVPDDPDVLRQCQRLADALDLSYEIKPGEWNPGRTIRIEFWPADGNNLDIRFDDSRYFGYPRVRVATGRITRVDAKGLMRASGGPDALPDCDDVALVCQWFIQSEAIPARYPTIETHIVQDLLQHRMARAISLGAVILGAHWAGVELAGPGDGSAKLALSRRWLFNVASGRTARAARMA